MRPRVVAVAQLVESRIVIPVVVGSSPIGHPNPFHVLTVQRSHAESANKRISAYDARAKINVGR